MAARRTLEDDRRRGPDLWMRSLAWLAVIGWLFLMVALFLAAQAKPEVETIFERWYNIPLRQHWDLMLARYIQYFMYLGLTLSSVGLGINAVRNRRRGDEIRISLVLLAFLSALGLALCLIYF